MRLLLLALCLLVGTQRTVGERSQRSVDCGNPELLTSNNGEIVSHAGHDAGRNYGKNFDCIWRIQAPVGQFVQLTSNDFDVEDYDYACGYDYLELYDGQNVSAPSLGKFCGTMFKPISSTQRFLTVQFVTDDAMQHGGFRLFYNFTEEVVHNCGNNRHQCDDGQCIESYYRCDGDDDCGDDSDERDCPQSAGSLECQVLQYQCLTDNQCIPVQWVCDGNKDCQDASDEHVSICVTEVQSVSPNSFTHAAQCARTNLTGESGTITSPNYPEMYEMSYCCEYFIQAPAGTQAISLTFDDLFGVEGEPPNCSYDTVVITGTDSSTKQGPFCGVVSPGEVIIQGKRAYVTFTSDGIFGDAGFRIVWKVVTE